LHIESFHQFFHKFEKCQKVNRMNTVCVDFVTGGDQYEFH